MGGFRCTYRDCSVRSDGQTHMFHYPVFDKPRCHKWLVKAQKLEFLDLKVSQLKNRVICQHHFKDDCFMNYKKDKLKFDAVPTEPGPFCHADCKPEDTNKYDISIEDIEQENLSTNEKKANFSIKYGDFLVNSELIDLTTLGPEETSKNIEKDPENFLFPYFQPTKTSSPSSKLQKKISTSVSPLKTNNLKKVPSKSEKTVPKKYKKINIIAEKKFSTPVKIKGQLTPVSPSTNIQISNNINKVQNENQLDQSYVIIENPPQYSQNRDINIEVPLVSKKADDNLIIINSHPSETRENYIIVGNPIKSNVNTGESIVFEQQVDQDAKEDFVIKDYANSSNPANIQTDTYTFTSEENVTNNDNYCKSGNTHCLIINSKSENVQTCLNDENGLDKALYDPSLMTLTVDDITKLLNEQQPTQSLKSSMTLLKTNQSKNDMSPSKTLVNASVKSKIPPERIAAIEHKRKINKQRLWNMKQLYLNEKDDQEKNSTEKTCTEKDQNALQINSDINKKQKQDTISKNLTESVKNMFSRDPKLPSFEEYTIASLESRIQKLEETLSRKIDQNTLRLFELKSMFQQESTVNKATETQAKEAMESEEKFKKRLFNEISKYLSPNTNSLIYEELFINKFVTNVNKNTSDLPEGSIRAKRPRKCKRFD